MEKKRISKWKTTGGIGPGQKITITRIPCGRYPYNYYETFKYKMEKYSDEELIQAFNDQVGNAGWGSGRAGYLTAIFDEFKERNYDYSAIGNEEALSFARRVRLVGKTIVPIE